jgi:hypothetical protein
MPHPKQEGNRTGGKATEAMHEALLAKVEGSAFVSLLPAGSMTDLIIINKAPGLQTPLYSILLLPCCPG